MALWTDLIAWLNEGDSTDRIELHLISSRVFDRLRERGVSQVEIDPVFRSLAPLEFHERHAGTSPWNCFFAPKMEAQDGRDEFPKLALLTSENVDEWAEVAESVKHPRLKARLLMRRGSSARDSEAPARTSTASGEWRQSHTSNSLAAPTAI
jgi:hypothetical protein